MDDELELILMSYGLDKLCDQYDINPLTVLKFLIEEEYISEEDLLDDFNIEADSGD